jgi:hypothetical protein
MPELIGQFLMWEQISILSFDASEQGIVFTRIIRFVSPCPFCALPRGERLRVRRRPANYTKAQEYDGAVEVGWACMVAAGVYDTEWPLHCTKVPGP